MPQTGQHTYEEWNGSEAIEGVVKARMTVMQQIGHLASVEYESEVECLTSLYNENREAFGTGMAQVAGQLFVLPIRYHLKYAWDGVGRLADGRRVYAMGVTGMMAEYALVNTADCVQVPEGLSPELAAILPNALLGSDAALLCRGQMQPGQVVLINGATGVSGRKAVQRY